jgi:sugar phosphate permease
MELSIEAELLFEKLGYGPLFQSKISYITYIFYVLIVLCFTKWHPLNNFVVYFLILILVGPFLFEPQALLLIK